MSDAKVREAMIEAVARAICEAHGARPGDGRAWAPDNVGILRPVQFMWELYARDAAAAISAVLLAIREPSEAMWTAGRDPIMARDICNESWPIAKHIINARFGSPPTWVEPGYEIADKISKGDCAAMTWRAMIDAYIAETTGSQKEFEGAK